MFLRLITRLLPALGLGFASLGFASLAAAQALPADTLDPAKTLPHFSVSTIDDTLKTVTGNHLAVVGDDGKEYVNAFAPNGLQFSIHFYQCKEAEERVQACGALQLLTSWQVDGAQDAVDKFILDAAPNNLFVNMGRMPDGRPYMSRIVIAGQGISQANLAAEIDLFAQSASQTNAQILQLGKE